MSIELNRDGERRLIMTAIKREMAFASASKANIAEHLSLIISEALFETAAITVSKGPEKGIQAGRELIRKWSD